jgi:hypothetical protein
MGGRRAKSLGDILGGGLGPQQASFTRAIGKSDPEGIATGSAKLAAESDKISEILYYVSKLADFVVREANSEQELTYEQRQQLARREWSRVKREEGIENDPVVTDAVVTAVAKAIGKRRK